MGAKKQLNEFIIKEAECIKFFYDNFIAPTNSQISNRKQIIKLANEEAIPITIDFIQYGKCQSAIHPIDCIKIFDKSALKQQGQNKLFIQHLRNAFCHKYVQIDGGRCRFLDWKQYEEGKKCKFSYKRITLIGDVDYEAFKELISKFFSEKSKTNNKKQQNNKN